MGFVDIEMGIKMGAHLFVIGREVFQAISFQEVRETTKAMHDAGVFKAPFKEIDVIIDANLYEVQKFINPRWTPDRTCAIDEPWSLIMKYKCDEDGYLAFICNRNDRLKRFVSMADVIAKYKNSGFEKTVPNFLQDLQDVFTEIFATLIVLLATKNIVKQEQEVAVSRSRLLSRKRKSQCRYSGITHLRIGKIAETFQGDGSRGPVRPHLRRGHVRNQRIGEGRKDVKKVFIQPVFVNADDGWIENQRKEYRIKV